MARQNGHAAERLRAYLRELKPGAQALLVAELERGLLLGAAPPGSEIVLHELRHSSREPISKSARFDHPARLFFRPVEPFLVDDVPDHKHRARIARFTLEPLWLWITNTLMPGDSAIYIEQIELALHADDPATAEEHSRALQDRVAQRLDQVLQGSDDKERRRLSAQLGT